MNEFEMALNELITKIVNEKVKEITQSLVEHTFDENITVVGKDFISSPSVTLINARTGYGVKIESTDNAVRIIPLRGRQKMVPSVLYLCDVDGNPVQTFKLS